MDIPRVAPSVDWFETAATNPHVLALAASCCAAVTAVALAGMWRKRRRASPEELERQRRLHVNGVGRFALAEIIDVLERPLPDRPQKVVIYHYEVSGVRYEASQDITPITGVDPEVCSPGFPANIKYDPNNPGNSIVACETWSGVR